MERETATHPANESVITTEQHETLGPNLAELQAYLAQYGETIVVSPRLPGVPLPLNSLVNACPKPPTEETAPEFLAEARMYVSAAEANEQTEDEKDEAEEDTEKDSDPEESKKKLS